MDTLKPRTQKCTFQMRASLLPACEIKQKKPPLWVAATLECQTSPTSGVCEENGGDEGSRRRCGWRVRVWARLRLWRLLGT
eukprot:1877533-Rhodomonas_salina.1